MIILNGASMIRLNARGNDMIFLSQKENPELKVITKEYKIESNKVYTEKNVELP